MEKDNLLAFTIDSERLISLAIKRREENDLIGALSILYKVYEEDKQQVDVLAEIAEVYTLMGSYEEANNFWIKALFDMSDRDKTTVYEKLAFNFYSMGNLGAARYYLHKKIAKDFEIGEDLMDDEFLDFIRDLPNARIKYYLAYPYGKADYGGIGMRAKIAFNSNNFNKAKSIYETIPLECMSDDVFSEYAMTTYMCEGEEEVLDVCKQVIEKKGETLTVCCVLSGLHHMGGNKDKSNYYYARAKELRTGDEDEAYRLITCALGCNDYITAKECLDIVIKTNEYDPVMNLLYGLSLFNCGKFDEGAERVYRAIRLSPENRVFIFYGELINALLNEKDKDKYLPLEVINDYPKSMREKFKKTVKSLNLNSKKVQNLDRNPDVFDALCWAVNSNDEELTRKAAIILGTSESKNADRYVRRLLLEIGVSEEIKKFLIFAHVLCQKRGDIRVIVNEMPQVIKRKKLIFTTTIDGMEYLHAYALALSRLIFIRSEGIDKLATSANKTYKSLCKTLQEGQLSGAEIATLMICACRYERFLSFEDLCKAFEVDSIKLAPYLQLILKGEKNG